MNAITTRDLTRVFKNRNHRDGIVALDSVTLDIPQGEVRGLLGPNGAGKTTLVKILSTLLTPTTGFASVLGRDVERQPKAVRPLIGIVLGGERGLYWNLTGRQNLEYWAALYNVPLRETHSRIAALLDRVGLLDRADDLVETFSRGMKQKLHLARGLIGDAPVLFLDEPTTGMDPVAARDFRNLVRELRSEGRTILLATHDMAEAESICDRVTLIDHGKVLAEETPQSLAAMIAKFERIDFEWEEPELMDRLRRQPGVASASRLEARNTFRVELSEETAAEAVLRILVEAGVTSIRTSRPSLDEVYLHLMGGLKTEDGGQERRESTP